MSQSKQASGFVFPVTATNPILTSGRADHSLRKLLYDFFTVGSRLEDVRRHLGNKVGLTGPQYSFNDGGCRTSGKRWSQRGPSG